MRTGDWAAAIAADLDVLHAFGDALAGTGKALVGTSGTCASRPSPTARWTGTASPGP